MAVISPDGRAVLATFIREGNRVLHARIAANPCDDELFVPAYRYRTPRGERLLLVWCPACGSIHCHGDTGCEIERRGIAEHCSARKPLAAGYTLVPIGTVASRRNVPRQSHADALRLSAMLSRAHSKTAAL